MAPTTPVDSSKHNTFRVLVTGFGPFGGYAPGQNPSWLAVRKLANATLEVQSEQLNGSPAKFAHITTLLVPVVYQDVLDIIRGVHLRPPVLPDHYLDREDPAPPPPSEFPPQPPPPDGYDLVVHVGVAGKGELRVESLAHKTGYNLKDYKGCWAPTVKFSLEGVGKQSLDTLPMEERLEIERIGQQNVLQDPEANHVRGFGKGYEKCPEELSSTFDMKALVEHMRTVGITEVRESDNAGRFLCEFIYYCSLANSELAALSGSSTTNEAAKVKKTPVVFLHCPPVNQPLSTEEVKEAIEVIVGWCLSKNSK